MHEEGWYTDPYGLHEARWMSDGHPTALVHDGGVEANDPAPEGLPTSTPQRIKAEGGDGLSTSDVLEANDTSRTAPNYQDAAEEGIDSSR